MELKNKLVVVTGAARGIGRAIALHLASKGAKLALIDLDADAMGQVVGEIEVLGSKAKAYVCNITDEPTVERTFSQIAEDFGRLDGLVNNAGIIRDGQLIKVKNGKVEKKMSAAFFDLVVDVHMKGAFLCAREAASHMINLGADEGVIINMSSMSYTGNFGQTNYSAAKAGMVAMSRVWSKELGRYNIRSMTIAPGTIETDMLRSMPQAAMDALVSQVPLRRIGNVEHIALAVEQIFTNDYLSGSVIEVNGGLRA